jgi:protein-disulfide isomerase
VVKYFFTIFLVVFASTNVNAEALYKLDGKTFSESDLSPAKQQALHEFNLQRYKQIEAMVEDSLLDTYFEELAAKKKKTKEEIEVEELKVKDPTEAQLKKFYEENKAKIPPNYTFDQVKGEIGRILSGQTRSEARTKLVNKIKKDRKFQFTLAEPAAPAVELRTAGFASAGKAGAKVKIVEFADYQCPHCKEAAEHMKKLLKEYGNKIELVFIDYPINRSGISRTVAEGAYCAQKQNKYWEYHAMAFARQDKLSKTSPEEFAKELKLDEAAFKTCLASAEAKTHVSNGKNEGDRVGVNGTPTIFMNGKKFTGGHDYKSIKDGIEKLL